MWSTQDFEVFTMVMVHIVVVLVMRVWSGRWVATIWKKYCPHLLLLWWRYSLGWALASFTIRLQALQSLALSPHSFIPIFLRSVDTSSSHLIFGIAVSCILSIWPSHHILWHLINLTMFSPLIMASNSSFRRILHNSFSFTGPYISRDALYRLIYYS